MDSCIIWEGLRVGDYGVDNGVLAHRAAWEKARNQKVPLGLLIHHICGTPLCVNPDHLVAVTHTEHRYFHPDSKAKRELQRMAKQRKRRLIMPTDNEIKEVLNECKGNKKRAAEKLNVSRVYLYQRLYAMP